MDANAGRTFLGRQHDGGPAWKSSKKEQPSLDIFNESEFEEIDLRTQSIRQEPLDGTKKRLTPFRFRSLFSKERTREELEMEQLRNEKKAFLKFLKGKNLHSRDLSHEQMLDLRASIERIVERKESLSRYIELRPIHFTTFLDAPEVNSSVPMTEPIKAKESTSCPELPAKPLPPKRAAIQSTMNNPFILQEVIIEEPENTDPNQSNENENKEEPIWDTVKRPVSDSNKSSVPRSEAKVLPPSINPNDEAYLQSAIDHDFEPIVINYPWHDIGEAKTNGEPKEDSEEFTETIVPLQVKTKRPFHIKWADQEKFNMDPAEHDGAQEINPA